MIRSVFAQQPVGQPEKIVEFETHVSYPALSFLPLVPFVWAGFSSVVPFYGLCLLLLIVVLVAAAPSEARPWIALLATTVTFVLSVIAAGLFEHWHDGKYGLESAVDLIPSFGISITTGAVR
jgi:VIT1/CCC1 family predicted Fe2+/Mn2+ transporter